MTDDRETLKDLRKWLWVNHGCPITRLYGDDGEMQCCGPNEPNGHRALDFKRQPLEQLWSRLFEAERSESSRLREELEKATEEIQSLKDALVEANIQRF